MPAAAALKVTGTLTLAPALCLLLFRNLKPARDNFLVRWLKHGYLRNLSWCLDHRALALVAFGLFMGVTALWVVGLPSLKERFPTLHPGLEEATKRARAEVSQAFETQFRMQVTAERLRSRFVEQSGLADARQQLVAGEKCLLQVLVRPALLPARLVALVLCRLPGLVGGARTAKMLTPTSAATP